MAEEQDEDELAEETHRPRECMPCRGSGKLISSLGGEPSTVPCPWCEGEGIRRSGVDAQARWLDAASGASAEI